MDHARALVDQELAAESARIVGSHTIAADPPEPIPPEPIDVIVPPTEGTALARAYDLLEHEKLQIVAEMGQAHMACVISELEEVAVAVERARPKEPDTAHQLELVEQEQSQLYQKWTEEIKAIIDAKLGLV